ncbi:MAG TPA: hypothetical protein VMX36_04510 [Sedimentisphaerales bacterium]|nr:hypothetical protein [Sedimentisphaerales bacterium]
MSFKNPKNLIVVVSVVAALLAGTVLLGGYAISKPADTEAPVKACQATGSGCPMMAASAGCPKMADAGQTGMPCTTCCPKPCCAGGNADGICDNPCPIPCPKPCCAEEGCCGMAGTTGCCPMTAVETAVE